MNKLYPLLFITIAGLAGCDNKETSTNTPPINIADRFLECAGSIKELAIYTKSLGDTNFQTYDDLGTIYLRAGANLADPVYAAKTATKHMQLTKLKIDQMASKNDNGAIINYVKSQLSTCSSLADEHKDEFDKAKSPILSQPTTKPTKNFQATLSCGMGDGNINVLACFQQSELIITQENHRRVYKAYNLQSAGNISNEGLTLDLSGNFEITAINSSNRLILGLKITDDSGRLVYQDQAGEWGIVSAKN